MSRISNRCTTHEAEEKHQHNFTTLLKANGNKEDDITNLKRMRRNKRPRNEENNIFYYQIPFISDSFNNQIRRIFRKQNINIRIAHRSFTLRKFLNNNNNKRRTPCTLNNCPVRDPSKCFRNHVVYQLECQTCHQKYIGSTIRPLYIRVREHYTQNTSSVYKHLYSCQHNQTNYTMITTIIGHHHEDINLRFLEHILIKQRSPTLNSQTDFTFLDPLLI